MTEVVVFSAAPGVRHEVQDGGFRAAAVGLRGVELTTAAAWFGMVVSGEGGLRTARGTYPLRAGMFFCSGGPATVDGPVDGLVVAVPGSPSLFMLGGPIESVGRLRYVDGCTDTLLLGPPRRGDPCLNHLHLPPGTRQRTHVHPSVRVGVIARGAGTCVDPRGETRLAPGVAFIIPAGVRHAFRTQNSPLDVFAFHPDSDVGPTDDDHPMINRTLDLEPGPA